MVKKTISILSIAASFYAAAQDVSTIKNNNEVYSANLPATAKYNSMAGATGALGGDVSSINTNPAGLGVAIASDLGGTLLIQNSKNTSTLFGNSTDYSVKNAGLGQVGGLASFEVKNGSPWKFVNLGVSYSTKSVEDYSEVSGNNNISFELNSADQNDIISFNRHAYDRIGSISKAGIGLGANYDNRLYFGGSVNIHGSVLDQSDAAEMTFASDKTSETFYKQYSPYSETGAGFSANIGVIGKINNQFRLGASIETPTWWHIEREYTFYDINNSENDGVYSEIRKLQTPLKATVSGAFVPNKNFAINMDYTVGLTKPKYKAEESPLESEFENFYSTSNQNMNEVKIGAEYRILGFRLRGGYALATSPFKNISLPTLAGNNSVSQISYSNLYSGKRNTLGVGLGYDFKSFYIDAAYNNIIHEYASPFLRGSSAAGSEYYSPNAFFANANSVVADVKNVQNNVSLTLGWKF